jgi:hypothetical protein
MIHSLLKTGGLFSGISEGYNVDTGKGYMSTVVNNSMNGGEKMTTDDVNDMISGSEIDMINSYTDGEVDLDELLNGTDLNSMLECEIFTDFSDLLLDVNGQAFNLDSEQLQQPISVGQKSTGIKRTAIEAFPESDANLNPSVDHNYHVPSEKKSCGESTELAEERTDTNDLSNVDDKYMRYLERRRKNNAASKRSREIKKNRMADMEIQAVHIEKENECLRERIVELDRLTKLMKSLLVQKVSLG